MFTLSPSLLYLIVNFRVNKGTCLQKERGGKEENGKRECKGASLFSFPEFSYAISLQALRLQICYQIYFKLVACDWVSAGFVLY